MPKTNHGPVLTAVAALLALGVVMQVHTSQSRSLTTIEPAMYPRLPMPAPAAPPSAHESYITTTLAKMDSSMSALEKSERTAGSSHRKVAEQQIRAELLRQRATMKRMLLVYNQMVNINQMVYISPPALPARR